MRILICLIALITHTVTAQCDLELESYNQYTGAMTIVVHEEDCVTEGGIVELTFAAGFIPPLAAEENPFPCVYTSGPNAGWALYNLPFAMPWINVGEGQDNMLNAGDTLSFSLFDAEAGTGTTQCFRDAIEQGAQLQCMAITILNINDSGSILMYPDSGGIANVPYPDDNLEDNMIIFGGDCSDPAEPTPPQEVAGCMTPSAYNYNPLATVSDDSCEWQGCLDPQADNYCDYCTVQGECLYVDVPECSDPQVYIPNTFTPNGDAMNPVWKPVTREHCWRTWELTVYNRWGSVVWQTDKVSEAWDGGVGTHYAPDGVYIWHLRASTYDLTSVISRTGHVTLFR